MRRILLVFAIVLERPVAFYLPDPNEDTEDVHTPPGRRLGVVRLCFRARPVASVGVSGLVWAGVGAVVGPGMMWGVNCCSTGKPRRSP